MPNQPAQPAAAAPAPKAPRAPKQKSPEVEALWPKLAKQIDAAFGALPSGPFVLSQGRGVMFGCTTV